MYRSLRIPLGVGMLTTMLMILLSGFWVGSSDDFIGISIGFAWGLVAAYCIDALKKEQSSD